MCYLLCAAALVVALRAHGPLSAAVAEQAFGAVRNLTATNAANRTLLGEAGMCPGECVCVLSSVFHIIFSSDDLAHLEQGLFVCHHAVSFKPVYNTARALL